MEKSLAHLNQMIQKLETNVGNKSVEVETAETQTVPVEETTIRETKEQCEPPTTTEPPKKEVKVETEAPKNPPAQPKKKKQKKEA